MHANPTNLLDLPTDLLVRILAQCESPVDVISFSSVSRLNAAPEASVVEEALTLRAREKGYALPKKNGVSTRRRCLFALRREANPTAMVAAGSAHNVFIDGEGKLSTCGRSDVIGGPGILGHSESVTQLTTPTRLPAWLDGEVFESVSAGDNHSIAVTAKGSVWSWGHSGCLGHGSVAEHQWQPKLIVALAGHAIVSATAGTLHSLAVTADGDVWTWGVGGFGQLGHGNHENRWSPLKIDKAFAGLSVVAVSAGRAHNLAVTADGGAWSWGSGGCGMLGHGCEENQLYPKRIEAFGAKRVVSVSSGDNCSFAVTADGAVWSWGIGGDCCLGHGSHEKLRRPSKIEALIGERVVAVSTGYAHVLALTADGAVWSWGVGYAGQLGHGDRENRLQPERVQALASCCVVGVAAGTNHSLALGAHGTAWSWGKGEFNRCGTCIGALYDAPLSIPFHSLTLSFVCSQGPIAALATGRISPTSRFQR